MGTHPIFESDFDCLTEMDEIEILREIFENEITYESNLLKLDLQKTNRLDVSLFLVLNLSDDGVVMSRRFEFGSSWNANSRVKLNQFLDTLIQDEGLFGDVERLRSFIDENIVTTQYLNEKPMNLVKSVVSRRLLIIVLDHMRNTQKYTDWILKTCKILDLNGFVWIRRHPLICLLGEQTEKFITRLKTETVDVDSKGKSCKEKMSKIIYHDSLPKENIFQGEPTKVEIFTETP